MIFRRLYKRTVNQKRGAIEKGGKTQKTSYERNK